MGFKAASDREARIPRCDFLMRGPTDVESTRPAWVTIVVGRVRDPKPIQPSFLHEWPDQPELWTVPSSESFKTSGFADVLRNDRPVLTLHYTSVVHAEQ